MLHLIPDVEVPASFDGYTLILPSVSVGNVGQLCVDMYISTLKCKKVGFLWHPSIMPLVGGDPFDPTSKSLTISSELYLDKEHKLLLLQIRSPIFKALVQDFLDLLLKWVESNNIYQVIVLTGSSYTAAKRDLIEGKKLRYAFTQNLMTENTDLLKTMKWTPIKKSSGDDGSIACEEDTLPNGGFANELFNMCAQESVRAAVLVKFCSEGDNIPDAHDLAEYLNQWIGVNKCSGGKEIHWVHPFSWKYLFGKLTADRIY